MLDIWHFRAEKGGDSNVVRESQRRHFQSVEIVDVIVAADKVLREGNCIDLVLYHCINRSTQQRRRWID